MLITSTAVFLLLVSGVFSHGGQIIGRRPGLPNLSRTAVGVSSGRAGLCRFGRSQFGCCYGWKRDNFGGCLPICENKCVHGTCVGPNRCKCDRGYTGSTCERDLNECSTRPCSHRCMNTPGSYRCYCEHGFLLLEDGTSCSRDDRCSATRCSFGCIQFEDGFTCFCPDGLALLPNGLGCTDVDECQLGTAKCPAGRRCKNTYGNYMCLCPRGYKFAYVNGELDCIDENECDSNRCDSNAYCVNIIGGFQCVCNEGFVGDGYKCVAVDSTTCLDVPCFQDVRCVDVQIPTGADAAAAGSTAVKQYRCGECPPTFVGDGETCNPTTIPIQVIAVDKMEGNTPLGEVNVKALIIHDDGQTEVIAEGTTDLNGIANLNVPTGVAVEFVASKDNYVDTVKTVDIQPEGGNVVNIPMEGFNEFTAFLYRQATSKAFEFGNIDEDKSTFRLSLPEGALRVPDLTTVNVNYKGVDVSSPDALAGMPDLSQIAGEPRARMIPLGAAELSITDARGVKVALRKPASMTFILKDYIELLGVRDSVDAYYYNTETGKWVKDGTGRITQTADGPTWTYETGHFTWWAVGIIYYPDICLTIRTCYDSACAQPVANIPIIISTENFVVFEESVTGASGSICTDIFTEEMNQVRVLQNCTGESQLVTADVSKTSLCGEGPDACQTVTFTVPATVTSTCPNPGEPTNGLRIGDDFSLGASVSFYCDAGFRIEGNSQRVCQQCGKWSGYQPFCTPVSIDSSYSGDSSLDF